MNGRIPVLWRTPLTALLFVLATFFSHTASALFICENGTGGSSSLAGPVRIGIDVNGDALAPALLPSAINAGTNPVSGATLAPGHALPCIAGSSGNDDEAGVSIGEDWAAITGNATDNAAWDFLAKTDVDNGATSGSGGDVDVTCQALDLTNGTATGGGAVLNEPLLVGSETGPAGAVSPCLSPDSGTWQFTASGAAIPWPVLAVVLKTANGYASFFVDVQDYIGAGITSIGGTWADTKNLSHISVYGIGRDLVTNSEPTSLVLLSLGLLGFSASRMRRRRDDRARA